MMSMRMSEMLYTPMAIYFYNTVDKCYCLYSYLPVAVTPK